jgi:uncharacterized membrane protein YkvA (DUF1232 family)
LLTFVVGVFLGARLGARKCARFHQERLFTMWKRLAVIWTLIRLDARQLWRALRHPHAPAWLKWGTAGVLLYLFSPVDLIPDVIPFLGVMDDLVIVPLAIRWLLGKLPQEIQDEVRYPRG